MTPPKTVPTSPLKSALESSITSANWLTGADLAQIEVARLLVFKLENATDPREILETAKVLSDVLKHLGLNVAGRTGKAEPKSEVTFLSEILKKEASRVGKTKSANPTKPRTKPRTVNK